jgi:SAM-dependent methyltransferase
MPGERDLESLQAVWDEHGRVDPMWAVLSDEGRRGGQWGLDDFFASGATLADHVLGVLADAGAVPTLGTCLDFGCGPGRVTQGLCRHFESVTGVDIAPSMIELAREHNRFGDRCEYHVNARPDLSAFADGTFDCVHSVIVLQHIDPPHALSYVREFVRVLAPGGVAVFQAPSHRREPVAAAPLGDGAFRARLEFAAPPPSEVAAGERFSVAVVVRNEGDAWWPAVVEGPGPFHVRVGNHWRTRRRGRVVVPDDGRTPLARDIPPGDEHVHSLVATAPARAGRYVLELDMVQERVAWFADRGSPTLRADVKVRRPAPGPEATPTTDAPPPPPPFAMHPLPRAEVLAAVAEAGAEVVAVRDDIFSGPDWISHTYVVRKP